MKKLPLYVFGGFALLILLMNTLFVVNQTNQALVLQFGKPVKVIREPGLNAKIPFIQNVVIYDDRLLEFNAQPLSAILRDKDRLVVDAFVRYRIVNPLEFYQSVRNEELMRTRLGSILEDALRKVLGKEDLDTLLSPKRQSIMKAIRDLVYIEATGKLPKGKVHPTAVEILKEDAKTVGEEGQKPVVAAVVEGKKPKEGDGFGIEIVDVRIMRTDLPKETGDAIFERMRSERQKVAEKFRAEGKMEAQKIQSGADKQRTIILSDAKKTAEEVRGQGEAESTRIYAEAFGRDPEFFEFYRAMQAYKKSLAKEDTTVVLSPDSPFLKHMDKR
jgi:modulator of FtsH protease HflC